MQRRGRTQRDDYLEDLQKMERRLKDEDLEPKTALTHLDKVAADLDTQKYSLAYGKLQILEIEHGLAKERASMDDAAIEEREREIAETRKFYAAVESEYEAAVIKLEVARRGKEMEERGIRPDVNHPLLGRILRSPVVMGWWRDWHDAYDAAQKEAEMSPDAQLYESMKLFRRWTRMPSQRELIRRSIRRGDR